MKAIRKGSREREFARRLDQSLSRQPRAPEGQGNTWLMRELTHQNVHVSLETIRKWLAGEVIPRRSKMAALAETLRVDEAWLSMGVKTATSRSDAGAFGGIGRSIASDRKDERKSGEP